MLGDCNGDSDGEISGDRGLKMSETRSKGLYFFFRLDEPSGFRRRLDGVEIPDNPPVGTGAPVDRRRRPAFCLCCCCLLVVDNGLGVPLPNCVVGLGVSVGLVLCGGLGFGIAIVCCCNLVGSRGSSGVALDFRRDGVKNKRLLRSFVGVVSSVSPLSAAAGDAADPRATEDVRVATVADGGVESAVKAILEASSNGDGLVGDSTDVDKLNGSNISSVVGSGSVAAGLRDGISVISIPCGDPKPWRRISDGRGRLIAGGFFSSSSFPMIYGSGLASPSYRDPSSFSILCSSRSPRLVGRMCFELLAHSRVRHKLEYPGRNTERLPISRLEAGRSTKILRRLRFQHKACHDRNIYIKFDLDSSVQNMKWKQIFFFCMCLEMVSSSSFNFVFSETCMYEFFNPIKGRKSGFGQFIFPCKNRESYFNVLQVRLSAEILVRFDNFTSADPAMFQLKLPLIHQNENSF